MKTKTVLNAILVMIAGTLASMQPASADHTCAMDAMMLNPHGPQEFAECIVENVGEGIQPLGESLRLRVASPDRVWISDRYEISIVVANQDPILHVVAIEVVPRTSNVCSVASYSTSSGATQTRPNEYVLQSNGTADLLGMAGGDSIAVGANIKPGAPGTCEIAVLITMDLVFQHTAVVSTLVEVPPPFADLGNYVATVSSCASDSVSKGTKPTSLTVAANKPIDIVASLQYAEPCPDDDSLAVMEIQKLNADGTWTAVGVTQLSSPGTSDARVTSKPTLAPGDYTYRMAVTTADKFNIDWACTLAILGAIGGVAAAIAAHGGTIATATAWLVGTIATGGWLAVAVLAAIIVAAIAIGLACMGEAEIFKSDPFTVTAIEDEPCAVAVPALNVGHLLEDLEDCVSQASQNPAGQAAETLGGLGL